MQSAKGYGYLEENGQFLQDEEEHVPAHQEMPHGRSAGDADPEREHEEQ